MDGVGACEWVVFRWLGNDGKEFNGLYCDLMKERNDA